MGKNIQKIYCYVDETGQDGGSEVFIVVAVIISGQPDNFRQLLIKLEKGSGIGRLKWYRARNTERIKFLSLILQISSFKFKVYFAKHKKNFSFFLSLANTITHSIKNSSDGDYKAIVCVDGIDQQKAAELTAVLRQKKYKT